MSQISAPRENKLKSCLIALIIVLQASIFIPPAAANGGIVQTFNQGFAEVVLPMQGDTTASAIVNLPRNTTFSTASFEISTYHPDSVTTSPGKVWLDVDEDGFWEWAWNGTGHGDMSHQTVFSDGSSNSSINIASNSSVGQGFILPPAASISSTSMNLSFIPEIGGGFWNIGSITDMNLANTDSDSLPEAIVLNSTSAGKTVGIFEWDSSGSTLISNWVATCENATDIRVADIDNDGIDDIGIFDSSEMQMCIHFTGSGLGGVSNVSLPSGSVDAYLSDLDGDGHADLVSANSNGDLNIRPWDSSQSEFGENQTQMIEGNETAGAPAQLAGLITGEFHGVGNGSSVVVFDAMGHATMWNWSSSSWMGPLNSFDGIKAGALIHDFDSNGYNDIIGMADGMITLTTYNGTGWNSTTVLTAAVDTSVIGDYDGNGNLEIVTPNPGSSDGSDSTFTGSLELRHLNGTSIDVTSPYTLQPWTSPKQVLLADLNGDGADEHIVAAGESQQGIFVSAWHSMSIDADNNSVPEATVYGYSGDGQNGLDPLNWMDMENNISQAISPQLMALGIAEDDYGNELAYISPNISANGNGTAIMHDLEVLYDVTLTIDKNPHISENLTNVFNQKMQGGNGTFNVGLPFNSTGSGNIKLSNMLAIWEPGAPNLAVPVQPQLQLDMVNTTGVFFHWQNITMWGEDLLGFQVFRTTAGGEFNFTAPLITSMLNLTNDFTVVVGQSYDYAVRSTHHYGITSNLSDRLTVTIPYPGPPADVQGISAVNVQNDTGGQIQVSWNENSDSVHNYLIYVHDLGSNGPTSFSQLGAAKTVSAGTNSTIVTDSSTVYDGVGNVIVEGAPLQHSTAYWVAVIAANQYGNQSDSAESIGPVYARNDTVMSSSISVDVIITDAVSGETVNKLVRQSSYSNGTKLTVSSTLTLDGNLASNQSVVVQITDGQTWLNYSGLTDVDGKFTPIDNQQFSNVIGQSTFGGEITVSSTYAGTLGSPSQQTIDSATHSSIHTVDVHATLSLLDDDIEVSLDGTAVMQLRMKTVNSDDQSLLEGTKLLWSVGNGSESPSGNGEVTIDSIGEGSAAILLSEGGWFNASFNPPSWLIINPSEDNPDGEPWVSATIRPYPYNNNNGNDNQSDNNQTQEEIYQPVVNCESWEISNLYTQNESEVECTVTNPNSMPINIDWSSDLWTSNEELNVNPSVITLEIPAGNSRTFDLTSSPSANLTQGAGSYNFVIEGTVSAVGFSDIVLEHTVEYSIVDDIGTPVDIGDNSTGINSNDSDSKSSSDDTMIMNILLGSIGAVVGIIAIVMVIARFTRDDDEDWDEDDLEFEDPDFTYGNSSKSSEMPSGRSLDEIKPEKRRPRGPITVEEITEEEAAEDNPFDISREKETFEEEEYEEYEEEYEEYEEEYEEYEEQDDGISTDDDGTEWWEDDDGVWWYRTTEMEDWAEYQE